MNEIETFYGLVENTLDALRIFQMCRDGRLNRVRRRLHERERRLIRSGSVFVFDEEESGIRRWTDGRLWSPSRILGNFLIYRELEKKGQRASKQTSSPPDNKNSRTSSASKRQFEYPSSSLITSFESPKIARILPKVTTGNLDMLWAVPHHQEQQLVCSEHNDAISTVAGINPQDILPSTSTSSSSSSSSMTPSNKRDFQKALLSSPPLTSNSDPMSAESLSALKSKKLTNNHKGRYIFKSDGGFIKKTISIQLEGHTHHLVAYYSLEDFCKGHLQLSEALQGSNGDISLLEDNEPLENSTSKPILAFDPQLMEILRQVPIPVDLMLQQNFRKPASLLASATSTAHGILDEHPENGEKLITALEYGAINPSDLQASSNRVPLGKRTSNGFINRGSGIIFASSKPTNEQETRELANPRPRRHSSFHPLMNGGGRELIPTDNNNSNFDAAYCELSDMLEESSQLSGDALEFLSHISDEGLAQQVAAAANSSTIYISDQNDFNFTLTSSPPSIGDDSDNYELHHSANHPQTSSFENDLESELFGSIMAMDMTTRTSSNAIKGEDVLLSDIPRK